MCLSAKSSHSEALSVCDEDVLLFFLQRLVFCLAKSSGHSSHPCLIYLLLISLAKLLPDQPFNRDC